MNRSDAYFFILLLENLNAKKMQHMQSSLSCSNRIKILYL